MYGYTICGYINTEHGYINVWLRREVLSECVCMAYLNRSAANEGTLKSRFTITELAMAAVVSTSDMIDKESLEKLSAMYNSIAKV
ncbi:hypothetical protein CDAR_17981 [Caerostris darwini]|uniref:Uncharacterized protein n=1 Tax=Caerostris darwini TaxID=1538125 RepID=A0AAV4PHL7_9ARAC|nr:hypothetical protein CDAR_17981 [Caerostris darwini]